MHKITLKRSTLRGNSYHQVYKLVNLLTERDAGGGCQVSEAKAEFRVRVNEFENAMKV